MLSRHRKLWIGLACLSLASVCGAVPALAQGSVNTSGYPSACSAESVPKSESDKAHDLFRSGKQYYDDNNQELAISLFKDAYKKDCSKHELLVIISRAYELKGDKAEAIRALEIFLQRDPSNSEADTYRRRIKSLRDQMNSAPPPTATPTTAPVPPKGEDRGHTVYPWILVGIGGAAVITGLVVVATAPALPAGCDRDEKTCSLSPGETKGDPAKGIPASPTYLQRLSEAGKSVDQPIIGGIVAGIGGGVVIAGLLWHILEPTGPAEASRAPKLRPETGPGYAGLTFGGSF